MVALNVDDAARRFHELIDRVARGEAVTIERDGQPIARITPTAAIPPGLTPEEEQARVDKAIAALKSLQGKIQATPEEIREWIEWGRM